MTRWRVEGWGVNGSSRTVLDEDAMVRSGWGWNAAEWTARWTVEPPKTAVDVGAGGRRVAVIRPSEERTHPRAR